ncbi:MAG: hypothetical protein IPK26_03570 [Planctomycetes bacterium]|nr:hypothetical protein [Planctomycetota bacterium]
MRACSFVPMTVALCAGLSAQNIQDFYFNCATGATTRGGVAGASQVQVVMRFDSEDYVGWGNPVLAGAPLAVTGYELIGCRYVIQDQNDGTVENYNMHFYGEDPANPSFPNFTPASAPGTNAIATFGPFPSPTTGTSTISAWQVTLNFTTPLVRPVNQDFFAALEFPGNAAWTADGLSHHISLGVSANFPPPTVNTYDLKGPALIAGGVTNTYGLSHDVTNQAFGSAGPRQYNWQFFVANGVGRGVVTTETNQGTYAISNVAPGTASFFSGLHPDASNSPTNPGRVDDINFVYWGAATGDLLVSLIAFGFQTEFPLVNVLPGSTGVLCLDLSTMTTAGFAVAGGTGTDTFRIAFNPSQRGFLLGLNLAQQVVAISAAQTGTASPCAMQRF